MENPQVTIWEHLFKCPKCDSTVNTDGKYVWCSSEECDYGRAEKVTFNEHSKLAEYYHEKS